MTEGQFERRSRKLPIYIDQHGFQKTIFIPLPDETLTTWTGLASMSIIVSIRSSLLFSSFHREAHHSTRFSEHAGVP